MPRNTAVLVFFLTLFAAAVVGINLFKNPENPAQTPIETSTTPTPNISLDTYQNDVCGVRFQYPSGINKLESRDGAVFSDPNATDSAVFITCQKDIPRSPLSPDRIETIQIGTVSATLYHDASPKDGSPIDKLIFSHPGNGLDIYVAGFGPVFRQLTTSIKLLW